MRIVIVEDEVKIREGMAKMISNRTEHVVVGEAPDGEEGLELIRRFRPDLVITDIRMPKMGGLDMLEQLSREQCKAHFIILSGYSEFEYAKKAIRYGVEEYLLKPLAAEDVEEMLHKIDKKLQEEEERLYGLAEGRLKGVLISNEKETEENRKQVWRDCGVESDTNCCMLAGYIGTANAGYRTVVENSAAQLKSKYERLKIYLVYHENTQIFYCLAIARKGEEQDLKQFEKSFYNRMISLYQKKTEAPIWAKAVFSNRWIGDVAEELRQCLRYALVIEGDPFITKDKMEAYEAAVYEYPKGIENRLKNAICQYNKEQVAKEAERFEQYLCTNKFKPADIRQAYIKNYYMIEDTLRELDQTQYEQLLGTRILMQLEQAYTFAQFKEAFGDLVKVVNDPKVQREDISNYVIKKAINYIRENYREGLTLEEVSGKLDITPEYLSTLFNREVGINFSVFLKRFRLSHAKRMLKGTEKKIYEIAEEVGYNDSKYFARVFKEEEGVSPAEYRQMK